jgi:chromosome segregation ATPase
MADTPTGETVTPEALSNEVTPVATPAVNAPDQAEVERLKKEAEQATLRANQLANQLKAKEDAEAAAKAKALEEQNQFKDLYEQEKAKREAFEQEQQEAQTRAELAAQEKAIFDKFDAEVVELAKDTGLTLTSLDDADGLTAKLEKIAAKVTSQARITPNNPAAPEAPDASKEELVKRLKVGDKAALTEALSGTNFIKAMKRNAGIEVE